MRDGQGCLLPVRHSQQKQQLLLLHSISWSGELNHSAAAAAAAASSSSPVCWSPSESEASPCIFSVSETNTNRSIRSAELELSCLIESESEAKTLRLAEPELRSADTEVEGKRSSGILEQLRTIEEDLEDEQAEIFSNGYGDGAAAAVALSDHGSCRLQFMSSSANCSSCFVRADEEGNKRLRVSYCCGCKSSIDQSAKSVRDGAGYSGNESIIHDSAGYCSHVDVYVDDDGGGFDDHVDANNCYVEDDGGDCDDHVDVNVNDCNVEDDGGDFDDHVDVNVDDCNVEDGGSGGRHCTNDQDQQEQPYLPGLDDEVALRCLAYVPISDLYQLSMVGRRYRDLVKSRLILKLRRSYDVVEHWVFIYTSGAVGWSAYDANQNMWIRLPAPNVDPAFELSDRESLSAGTNVLWLGKGTIDFIYYRYDLLTNHWEKGPDMVNPRCLFASASCRDFAFVAGGFGCNLRLLKSAERYNSHTGEWEALPPMSTPRHKCSGFFMDGKFYVIGGRDAQHRPIMSAEEYNPATGTWRTIENMYFAQEASRMDMFEPSPPLVAVVNNQLYSVENSTNILKLYNKHTNTWRNLGPLPVPADLRNGWGVAFKALGDKLFVMGDTGDGIIACCWQPGPNPAAPEWQILCHWERGVNSFLFNCAVMSC